MKDTFKSYLPVFTGFYNTIFEAIEDREVELTMEEYDDYDINNYGFKYLPFREEVCKIAVEKVQEALQNVGVQIEIKFEKIVSPEYYHCLNDRIAVEIKTDIKELCKILNVSEEVLEKDFVKLLTDFLKSKEYGVYELYYDITDSYLSLDYTYHNMENLENLFLKDLDPLLKEVYELGGVDFEDLWNYTKDYLDPSSGSVGGLIYYDDTEPFARNNFDEISEKLDEIGIEKRLSLNDMTWSTWSLMMMEFENFKEKLNYYIRQ